MILQQRNYYQKYKTYYYYLGLVATLGLVSGTYIAYKILKYIYNKKVDEENQVVGIRKYWILQTSKYTNILINLTLFSFTDLLEIINLIDDLNDKLKIKHKVKFVIIVNVTEEVFQNYSSGFTYIENVEVVNICLSDIHSIMQLDKYVSYYCISLGLNLSRTQNEVCIKDLKLLNDKVTLNHMILTRISRNFDKNYKKSCIFIIDLRSTFDVLGFLSEIDKLFNNKITSFYDDQQTHLESSHKFKIIFKKTVLSNLELPLKNFFNTVVNAKSLVLGASSENKKTSIEEAAEKEADLKIQICKNDTKKRIHTNLIHEIERILVSYIIN